MHSLDLPAKNPRFAVLGGDLQSGRGSAIHRIGIKQIVTNSDCGSRQQAVKGVGIFPASKQHREPQILLKGARVIGRRARQDYSRMRCRDPGVIEGGSPRRVPGRNMVSRGCKNRSSIVSQFHHRCLADASQGPQSSAQKPQPQSPTLTSPQRPAQIPRNTESEAPQGWEEEAGASQYEDSDYWGWQADYNDGWVKSDNGDPNQDYWYGYNLESSRAPDWHHTYQTWDFEQARQRDQYME